MPFTDDRGVRLHWEEQGSGTPVLLVMGATYSSEMWWHAIPALAERHRVIRFDNRGTGQSQSTKVASIPDMAADAIAVLDAAGVDQAHVWGVSLGGVVVQELAITYPDRVRSLVVGCSGILSSDKPRSPKLLNLLAYVPLNLRMRLLRRGSNGTACPPELAEQNRAVLAADRAKAQSLVAQQNALRAYAVTPERIRAGLTMPVLVQHGDEDTLVPLAYGEEVAATVPGSRIKVYEGSGHNYVIDSGDAAIRDVLEFVAEVDAAHAGT
jgi:pimeloyl-ACP methyl ester carboxylesterase